jgi:signal transduction histidine kinase
MLDSTGSVAVLVSLMAGGLVSLFFYEPFSRMIDRRLFGVERELDKVIRTFSTQIATRMTMPALAKLIRESVLPTLLIRQSVLVTWPPNGVSEIIFAEGVAIPPNQASLESEGFSELNAVQLVQEGQPLPLGWVRLAIPLKIENQRAGLWLLGEHDPDDLYLSHEIDWLISIAGQIAITLGNINQSRRLLALYLSNINRHEQQRRLLGQDLHDEIINGLSLLVHRASQPDVVDGLNHTIDLLRETVSGLRPPVLNYGLYPGMRSMVEDLRDRSSGRLRVVFEVKHKMDRYHPVVETQLYQIIHQASENVLRHAYAKNLIIEGQLDEKGVHITVRDDGHGFELEPPADLLTFLETRKFGLAGMYERAGLINARLTIYTAPGAGTSVTVSWEASELREDDIQFLMS